MPHKNNNNDDNGNDDYHPGGTPTTKMFNKIHRNPRSPDPVDVVIGAVSAVEPEVGAVMGAVKGITDIAKGGKDEKDED
jgi:hypothetical protein